MAPSPASFSAMAWPIPEPAPVTKETRPSNAGMGKSSCLMRILLVFLHVNLT
ncbi:MAG: hypothetical protein VW835_11235 [Rickettsiales bacterium]